MSDCQSEQAQRAVDNLREVLLTLSSAQFEGLARDLKLLREHGAESNTKAILGAVRDRADMVRSVNDRRAA